MEIQEPKIPDIKWGPRFLVLLKQEQLDQISRFQEDTGIDSRIEAIRYLISAGLDRARNTRALSMRLEAIEDTLRREGVA